MHTFLTNDATILDMALAMPKKKSKRCDFRYAEFVYDPPIGFGDDALLEIHSPQRNIF